MTPVETDLCIEVRRAGEVTVLALHGALNVYTAGTFIARAEDALGHGAISLVVNIEDAGFLDSEGIGALLRLRRRVQLGGGTLVLAAPPVQAVRTIAVKGLSLVLLCSESETQAVAFLTSGPGGQQ